MNIKEHTMNIVVVEDSLYYNKLITRHLAHYLKSFSAKFQCRYSLSSYIGFDDFIQYHRISADIAFLDYYLGEYRTGAGLIQHLRKTNDRCKAIVLSHVNNTTTKFHSLRQGATCFIHKADQYILAKASILIENTYHEKYNAIT